jgi:hypothetical protein
MGPVGEHHAVGHWQGRPRPRCYDRVDRYFGFPGFFSLSADSRFSAASSRS